MSDLSIRELERLYRESGSHTAGMAWVAAVARSCGGLPTLPTIKHLYRQQEALIRIANISQPQQPFRGFTQAIMDALTLDPTPDEYVDYMLTGILARFEVPVEMTNQPAGAVETDGEGVVAVSCICPGQGENGYDTDCPVHYPVDPSRQVTCPVCEGRGGWETYDRFAPYSPPYEEGEWETCERCRGVGSVPQGTCHNWMRVPGLGFNSWLRDCHRCGLRATTNSPAYRGRCPNNPERVGADGEPVTIDAPIVGTRSDHIHASTRWEDAPGGAARRDGNCPVCGGPDHDGDCR